MTGVELDMIQTAGIGATCRYGLNEEGRFPTEILCAVASKRWYHLFVDNPDAKVSGNSPLTPDTDTMVARFWQSKEGADRVDQLPTVAARHEAMKGLTQRTLAMGSCFISYVGKANFAATERYIREMYTEVYSAHALGAEISAIGGTFCISFMQLFTTDVYLNAFLSELKQIGLDYTVLERRPIRVASVADYRK